jgi:hypothetical protein
MAAVPKAQRAVVTQAGPTAAAPARGVEIPGTRVVGVLNDDFAVRLPAPGTAAMIGAPVGVHATEDADGSALALRM